MMVYNNETHEGIPVVSNFPAQGRLDGKMLATPPSGGEPGQPRNSFQRRQRSNPLGARCRNSIRGLRSYRAIYDRKCKRTKRRRGNRRTNREFRQWFRKYVSKQCAPEPQRRRQFRHAKDMPDRNTRKRMLIDYKKTLALQRPGQRARLAYNKPLKVATLNVRGLIGENAVVKKELLVDIMKKQCYDVLLLQETNINTNSVETLKGYRLFFSTDIKPGSLESRERAGVGIIVSKELLPFYFMSDNCQGDSLVLL